MFVGSDTLCLVLFALRRLHPSIRFQFEVDSANAGSFSRHRDIGDSFRMALCKFCPDFAESLMSTTGFPLEAPHLNNDNNRLALRPNPMTTCS